MSKGRLNDIHDMAQWASQIADNYNKSITYVLMQIHEGLSNFQDISRVKEYVISQIDR